MGTGDAAPPSALLLCLLFPTETEERESQIVPIGTWGLHCVGLEKMASWSASRADGSRGLLHKRPSALAESGRQPRPCSRLPWGRLPSSLSPPYLPSRSFHFGAFCGLGQQRFLEVILLPRGQGSFRALLILESSPKKVSQGLRGSWPRDLQRWVRQMGVSLADLWPLAHEGLLQGNTEKVPGVHPMAWPTRSVRAKGDHHSFIRGMVLSEGRRDPSGCQQSHPRVPTFLPALPPETTS